MDEKYEQAIPMQHVIKSSLQIKQILIDWQIVKLEISVFCS